MTGSWRGLTWGIAFAGGALGVATGIPYAGWTTGAAWGDGGPCWIGTTTALAVGCWYGTYPGRGSEATARVHARFVRQAARREHT